MLAALALALLLQDATLPDAPPSLAAVLPSPIAEVVVHRTLARVTRTVCASSVSPFCQRRTCAQATQA